MINSALIITDDIEQAVGRLKQTVTTEEFTLIDAGDSFLVEHVKEAVAKAYLASDRDEVIVLAAKGFSDVVQNRLLKILEEPPFKKHFVLITQNQSSILPTVKSRLPLKIEQFNTAQKELELDLENLTLQGVYQFVQANRFCSALEATWIVEQLYKALLRSSKFKLDSETHEMFTQSRKALDVGANVAMVFNALLLKLLAIKRKRFDYAAS